MQSYDVVNLCDLLLTYLYVRPVPCELDFRLLVDSHRAVFENDDDDDNNNDKDETHMCPIASDSYEYDMEEPILTGKVLGKFVINIMAKIGLKIENCVRIGINGCSVMTSKMCDAVTTIQKVAPHTCDALVITTHKTFLWA